MPIDHWPNFNRISKKKRRNPLTWKGHSKRPKSNTSTHWEIRNSYTRHKCKRHKYNSITKSILLKHAFRIWKFSIRKTCKNWQISWKPNRSRTKCPKKTKDPKTTFFNFKSGPVSLSFLILKCCSRISNSQLMAKINSISIKIPLRNPKMGID